MGTTALVERKIENGKDLVSLLDSNGIKFPSALWMKSDDDSSWTLFFGVRNIENFSKRELLHRIYKITKEGNKLMLFDDIQLIDNEDSILESLRMMITTDSGINEISFFGNFINGHKFPDSIIYRIN